MMTDDVLAFLAANDFVVESRDKDNPKLTAFRRNIYFPEMRDVKGCGFFFPIRVPSIEVLCSMKLSALTARAKGRDFYDSMFLLALTRPDYNFLKSRCGIGSPEELKSHISELLQTTNLNVKVRDFEHLLFNSGNAKKILRFEEFIISL